MREGERALLLPAGAGGALGLALGSFLPPPQFWDESPGARQKRWEAATRAGERGGALLAKGATEAAARAYGRALRWAVLAGGVPALYPPGRKGVKAELHAGLALCQLRLGIPAAASANASKALELRPGHTEARVRRAMAASAMGDLEVALEDLREVLRVAPGHVGAREELRRVRRAARERDARLARRLGRLFA
ncbi:FKBPL protein, partial [Centropus bengalensis]|nr:FKBPL protein [Centropus bengalensis]